MAKKAKAKKRVVKKREVILPRKMSSLIKIALRDIRKAEATEKYIMDMNTFHSPTELVCSINEGAEVITRHEACVVCAAGAVMAFSLKADPTKSLDPDNFNKNQNQLAAIDHLRQGLIHGAFEELNPDGWSEKVEDKLDTIPQVQIPHYDRDAPEPFHKAMEKLEAVLKKSGF